METTWTEAANEETTVIISDRRMREVIKQHGADPEEFLADMGCNPTTWKSHVVLQWLGY